MNIARTIEHGRRDHPDRPALIFEGTEITYAALDDAANSVARALRDRGIGRGDRVALLMPNVPEFAYAYYGALKLGAIVVSINTSLMADEIEFIVQDSGAAILLSELTAFAARPGAAIEAVDLPADAPAAIVYTSGTTGVPKGATLSHGNVTFAMTSKQRYLGITPEDRLLLFLPLYHCFGQNAILNAAMQAGATVVLQRGFDAGQRARLARRRSRDDDVRRAGDVQRAARSRGRRIAAIAAAAGEGQGPLAGVRYCFSAAAPLPIQVETAWRERFGLVIHQGYGLTETSPFASYNHATAHRAGSIGVAIDQVEMRVVDVRTRQPLPAGERGEIVIRGPNVMLGYWNRPNETAEVMQDGWFHTGDIGRTDVDGYFYIEDRIKDMVIIGGSNVYPAEIENVLSQHPAVADAAVFGVPAPVLGERVWAAVVLGPGATVTESEIIAFCRARMAHFKVPARVEFVDELPRNRTGKVLKRVLRQRHGAPAGPITPSAASGMHRDEFNVPVTPDLETIQVFLLRWLGEALQRRETARSGAAAGGRRRHVGDWRGARERAGALARTAGAADDRVAAPDGECHRASSRAGRRGWSDRRAAGDRRARRAGRLHRSLVARESLGSGRRSAARRRTPSSPGVILVNDSNTSGSNAATSGSNGSGSNGASAVPGAATVADQAGACRDPRSAGAARRRAGARYRADRDCRHGVPLSGLRGSRVVLAPAGGGPRRGDGSAGRSLEPRRALRPRSVAAGQDDQPLGRRD